MYKGYSRRKAASILRLNGDDINQRGTTQRAMDSVKGTDYQGPVIDTNQQITTPKKLVDKKG